MVVKTVETKRLDVQRDSAPNLSPYHLNPIPLSQPRGSSTSLPGPLSIYQHPAKINNLPPTRIRTGFLEVSLFFTLITPPLTTPTSPSSLLPPPSHGESKETTNWFLYKVLFCVLKPLSSPMSLSRFI